MKTFCKIFKLLGKVISIVIFILIIGAIILYIFLKVTEYEDEKIMINWIEPLYSDMTDKYDELRLKDVDFKGRYDISFDIVKDDCSDEEIDELISSIDEYIHTYLQEHEIRRLDESDYKFLFYYKDKCYKIEKNEDV